jgi:hypothetical protein
VFFEPFICLCSGPFWYVSKRHLSSRISRLIYVPALGLRTGTSDF